MSKIKQTMVFAWSKNIAPNVLHIALKPETELTYQAGQFITLHFTRDDQEVRRSYSIANPPSSTEYIEFAISYQPQGVASEEIFNMEPGQPVDVSGPAGRLILLDEHPARYVLVATGTGVTPYRAMLNQINEILATKKTKFLLLFGVRSQSECLYYDEFTALAQTNPDFEFQVYYSREMPTSEQTTDLSNKHKGYVQLEFAKYNLDPDKDMVYLCGNPNMIDDAYPRLLEFGFTAKTVRREKYISSK